MSTRSRISWKKQDGTIESIYCHHDGYPEYVGNILVNNYDEKNLDKLMALGDLSTLGEVPTSDPKGWDDYSYIKRNRCCLAYKDRGETNVDSLKFASEEEFKEACEKGLEEECNYLYKKGKWYFWYCGGLKIAENVENLL